MKGIREIKNRIKAINNTAKITRAMQLVSSSKMKRAQQLAINSRPYLLLLAEIAACISSVDDIKISHPFFVKREIKNRGVLVIGTEKGLCGALNQNIFKSLNVLYGDLKFISVGKRSAQFLSNYGKNLIASFQISDRVDFHEVKVIIEFLKQAYLEDTIDTIEVVFPRFVNALVQEPIHQRVLPMLNFDDELNNIRNRMKISRDEVVEDNRDMIIEPSVNEILNKLTSLFLTQNIYKLILEAKAAEHSARMMAMKNATDNAENISKALNIEYNKARQDGITNEIIEIAAASQGF